MYGGHNFPTSEQVVSRVCDSDFLTVRLHIMRTDIETREAVLATLSKFTPAAAWHNSQNVVVLVGCLDHGETHIQQDGRPSCWLLAGMPGIKRGNQAAVHPCLNGATVLASVLPAMFSAAL